MIELDVYFVQKIINQLSMNKKNKTIIKQLNGCIEEHNNNVRNRYSKLSASIKLCDKSELGDINELNKIAV